MISSNLLRHFQTIHNGHIAISYNRFIRIDFYNFLFVSLLGDIFA